MSKKLIASSVQVRTVTIISVTLRFNLERICLVELNGLLDKAGVLDQSLESSSSDCANERWLTLVDAQGNLIGHGGGSSGGYADYVMYRAIRDVFHSSLDQVTISKTQRYAIIHV